MSEEKKLDIGLAEAFRDVFISPNVSDRNMEDANVVDALDKIAEGLFAIARSIGRNPDPVIYMDTINDGINEKGDIM